MPNRAQRRAASFLESFDRTMPIMLQMYMRNREQGKYREQREKELAGLKEERESVRMRERMEETAQRGRESRQRASKRGAMQRILEMQPGGTELLERFMEGAPETTIGQRNIRIPAAGEAPASGDFSEAGLMPPPIETYQQPITVKDMTGLESLEGVRQARVAAGQVEETTEQTAANNQQAFTTLQQRYPDIYSGQTFNPGRKYTQELKELDVAESRPRPDPTSILQFLLGGGGGEPPPLEPPPGGGLSPENIGAARQAVSHLPDDNAKRERLREMEFTDAEIEQIMGG